jgi:uncharacterized membrane protein YbhN (UPF0104 family)
MASPERPPEAPSREGVKRKLIRGAIVVAALIAVAIGLIGLLPGLAGMRAAIADASPWWVLAGAGIQLVGTAGAVVFVQLIFADEPHRLTWKMGGAQQAANAVLPSTGSTLIGYWTLNSIGWGLARFAERTAVLIVAPSTPNLLLIIVLGLGMGLGLFAGPSEWWLTWLPAAVGLVVVVVAILAARWGHRLAARTERRWLRELLRVLATGVTGTVDILRRRDWRVLGTWADVFASLGALWACLIAVGEHLPFAVIAMGFLVGQFAQVIPMPGGVGTIDAGVTGALVLYGGGTSVSAAGEVISHGLALLVPFVVGSVAFALLPGEIDRTRRHTQPVTSAPSVSPTA